MATQTVQFAFLTGQTPTVKLFVDDGTDTVVATPTATEATNRKGIYTFNLTDQAAGTYLMTVVVGAIINAEYLVTLTLDTAVFKAYERSDPKLAAIHAKLPSRSHLLGTTESTGQIGASDLEEIASAIWDDDIVAHQIVGTFGAWVQSGLASASALATVSGKIDAVDDLIDTEVAAIKAKTDNLPADPADASDIAAAFSTVNTKLDTIDDFLDTEVAAIKAKTDNLPADPADASGIAAAFSTVNTKLDTIDDFLDTEVAAIKVVTDKYGTMVVQDGLVYQFTTNALENGPAGGGGGSTVAVYPLNATMPARVYDLNLTFYKNEDGTVVGPVSVTSRNANVFEPVDLSGRTLSVRFVDYEGTELLTVANGDITVSGADNNQISFPVTSALTGSVTETPQDQWHIWTLHDLTSGDNVLIGGKARVLLC